MTGGAQVGLDRLYSIEYVIGGKSGDEMIAAATGSSMDGYEGNDTLKSGLGNDSLIGGLGEDTTDYVETTGTVIAVIGFEHALNVLEIDAAGGKQLGVGTDFKGPHFAAQAIHVGDARNRAQLGTGAK